MGQEGVSDRMVGVANGEELAFGGVEGPMTEPRRHHS